MQASGPATRWSCPKQSVWRWIAIRYDGLACNFVSVVVFVTKRRIVENFAPYLCQLTETQIDGLVDDGSVLRDAAFSPEIQGKFGQFYAPFDWINADADIVLIGITPGKRQVKSALKALRAALAKGKSTCEAARVAKQAASFEGDMRDIAARLMNRFKLDKLFRLHGSSDLFGPASCRAHYTSLLRNPVLHWQTKKQKNGEETAGWSDYSGGNSAFSSSNSMLFRSIAADFEPEIAAFTNSWFVPFGPVPALALEKMAQRGLIDRDRILSGINHPSGTQWNRHNCQLNTSDDHSQCAKNVGCKTIRGRSKRLETVITKHLQTMTG